MFRRFTIIVPFAVSGLPLRVMRCLGPLGARFILLSTEADNVARSSAYCREFILSRAQSDADVLLQLRELSDRLPAAILLPVTTKGFQFVAEHRQWLSERFQIPPISSLESLTVASDKWKLHDFSLRHELPVLPAAQLSESLVSDVGRAASIRFPVLVKPSRKENGKGIRKVDTLEELRALYDKMPETERDGFLVQTYVAGDDYSLSVYCEEGEIKAYTLWRAVLESPVPFTIPTCIQFMEDERSMNIGRKLLRHLKFQGVCDVDLLVDRRTGEVWILEINARFWANVGACLKCGVNFPLLMVQAANGSRADRWPRQTADAIFCYARGAMRGLRHPLVRGSFARHPLRTTGLDMLARDPVPEFRRLQAKLGRMVRRGAETE